ncbi:MAG TPA: ABC transporter substrate-binding protein [Aeromicrobium sp.]|nr:ABC transporter substrate-binding protein [Aeromicrobium sp.]
MRLRRSAIAGIALAAAASLTLAACGGGSDDGSDKTDAVITAYGTEPQNPLITTNTNEVGGGNIIDLIYAGLVSYKADGSQELEVADSIKSDDNKVWTIKLKDWKFSDGTEVTAKSFADAWNYGATGANAQLQAYFYSPFEGTDDEGIIVDKGTEMSGVKVIDDKTLEVTLKAPEALFPLRLGYAAYYPLPAAAFKDMAAFGKAPIGNGPYNLEKWEHNAEAVMVPNKDYDGNRKAKNGGVTFKLLGDPEGAYSQVQAGELDVMDQAPPSALTTFMTDKTVQGFEAPGTVNGTITIPESLAGFSGEEGDLRRQAISKAINRKEITEKIFDGTRTPSTDFSSPLMPEYTADIPGSDVLKFDAAGAKKLWAEADAIKPFAGKFQVAYNADGPGNKEWVEALTNQLKNNLGIDAEPKAYPTFSELRAKVTDRTIGTAFRTGWQPDYPSVYNYLGPIFGTGAGSNDGDYSNKEFDKLLNEGLAATGEESAKKFADAQEILFKELPAIPLWNTNVAAVAAKGVKNVEFNWQNKPEYQNITK